MRALPLAGLAAGFLLAAASSSCRGLSHPSPKVLLITLDTTRADHLGCYGDTGAMTPNLDAFAKEAVRFDQAMTSVPVTLPSHATMFTGVDPPVHGVRYNGMFKLGAQSVTIAERLREAGFQTGAVPAAFPVNAKSGLGQGFAIYRDLFSEPGADKLKSTESRKAADVTRLGLEWVRSAAKGPFFGWLHYYDAHYPYEPPFPFSSRFRDHPYDGEIAYVDAQLGELFAGLKREGIWDDLTVVIVGDHGEGLYEHGERMHAQLAYQSTLRVPLLIKSPGARRGSVISEPVTLADIAPTILDLAGRPVPEGLDGFSLRSALGGAALPRRTLYFETLAGSLAFGWSPIEGVRRGKWKLIRSSDPELYDLDADPGEANNVFAAEGSVVADLSAILDEAIARWGKTSAPAEATAAPLDAEELSRLTSLGYVGGSVTAARRGGPSPRSMEHLESELLLLQDMMEQRRYRDVLVSAANVLKDDPGNRLVLGGAAESSASTRDFATAERYGIELATRYPEYVPGVVTLGRIYVGEAKYGEAEKVFRTGLEHSPDEPLLVYSLTLTLIAQGRAPDARPLAETALAKKGADPAFRIVLAVCKATAGDAAGAKIDLQAAIAAGYDKFQTLRSERLFEPLRAIPGFKELVDVKKAP